MTLDKDTEIYVIHGEILTLFSVLKDRVFDLGKLGVDTTKLLVSLNIFAETMLQMAQSESECQNRKAVVEELLRGLNRGKDERKTS